MLQRMIVIDANKRPIIRHLHIYIIHLVCSVERGLIELLLVVNYNVDICSDMYMWSVCILSIRYT